MAPVTKKITEKRLKWYYGHVKRRDEGHVLRRMLDAPVTCRRHTERKTDNRVERLSKRYMESVGLKVEDILDRTKWKRDIQNHSGDPR